MCGIVGYTGVRPAVGILLEGLKRLEYRGYDSSGVAFFRKGLIEVRKSEGKLENVARELHVEAGTDATITCGIGHTRWATHGKPTTQNAHPHQVGEVVLVTMASLRIIRKSGPSSLRAGELPEVRLIASSLAFLSKMNSMQDKSLWKRCAGR